MPNAKQPDPAPPSWTATRSASRPSLAALLMLALILPACSTLPAIKSVEKEPLPAALIEPESESLKTFSERARAWLKKVGDTLNNSETTGKP